MAVGRQKFLAKWAFGLAGLVLAIAVPVQAATSAGASDRGAGTPVSGDAQTAPGLNRALVAPLALPTPTAPGAAQQAAATCARYAAQAGWANNGYYGGDLVTAATICVSESGGDPNLIVCDQGNAVSGSGNYPTFSCPPGATSYDRGLWQLNSKNAAQATNACAFNPVCNAGQAYLISGRGTFFALWSSYDLDVYANHGYLDAVQAAVTALKSGTVTSAELGECLAAGGTKAGAPVVIANCGSGAARQQWAPAGGKLRSGGLCAAIGTAASHYPIVLRPCARNVSQSWLPSGTDELRNPGTGRCLTDPGGNLTVNSPVYGTRCAQAKDQIWWLP